MLCIDLSLVYVCICRPSLDLHCSTPNGVLKYELRSATGYTNNSTSIRIMIRMINLELVSLNWSYVVTQIFSAWVRPNTWCIIPHVEFNSWHYILRTWTTIVTIKMGKVFFLVILSNQIREDLPDKSYTQYMNTKDVNRSQLILNK